MSTSDVRREPLQLHAPTAISHALIGSARAREEFADLLPTTEEMRREIRQGMSYHFALANFPEDLVKIGADSIPTPLIVAATPKPFDPLLPYRRVAGLAITQPYRPQRGPYRNRTVREILELSVASDVAWEPVVAFLIEQCKNEVIRNAAYVLRIMLAPQEEALANVLWADGFDKRGKNAMVWRPPKRGLDSES